jgi:sugar phosphate isomerase/epimerase
MIELGCHSRNYGGDTPEEIFEFIRKLGFRFIDVDAVGTIKQEDVIENPEKLARYTKELSDKYELALGEYFVGNLVVNGERIGPTESDLHKRKEMFANFEKICKYANLAGFRSIMGAAGSLDKQLGFDRSFELAAQALGEMVRIGSDHGIAVHVEPSRQSLLNKPSAALEMVQAVEGLTYTLDFLHYQVNGYDQQETMKLLAYTGHMHARQAAVGWPKCPFEHGEIDFDLIIKRLRGLRWQGIITMEFWNGPIEAAAGMCPIEQTILMRYHLKNLIKKYN